MTASLLSIWILVVAASPAWGRDDEGHADDTTRDAEEAVKPVARVHTEAVTTRTLVATVEGLGAIGGSIRHTFDVTFARPVVLGQVAVVPGQMVRTGEALLELPPDPVAGLTFRQASLALTATQGELARVKDLYSRQLATRGQLAAAQRAVAEAQAVATEQREMGAGDASTQFKSPFDAIVLTVTAAPGARVQPGTPVMQLGPATCAEVSVGIEPQDARDIHPGMPAVVTAALDESLTTLAVVAGVGGAVNPTSQLVDVWLKLATCPLLTGTKVVGRIEVRTVTSLTVPRGAVLSDEKGRYVFVADAGKSRRVDVTTVLENQSFIAVESSLRAGMKVVTTGAYELEAGMMLKEDETQVDKKDDEKAGEAPQKIGEH